ncbi:MAG: response regulator [Candidatus Lokiarchaeota archaeon]|nr:response regulator [Candidatus Lokiarchaeota archaeon]
MNIISKNEKDKKDYYSGKKRISVYISDEVEEEWQEFIKNNKISSISKLIREGINYYIEEKSSLISQDLTVFTHSLKERFTIIKGNLQLIMEKYQKDLNNDILSIINHLLKEIKQFEERFIFRLEKSDENPAEYEILLIEDDLSTIELVTNFFEAKGYTSKGVITGAKGLEELNFNTPKLILLDIILPDVSGFTICKKIKTSEKFKNIPLIYLTAVPGNKVNEKIEETKADGYILKPFDLADFDFVFQYL